MILSENLSKLELDSILTLVTVATTPNVENITVILIKNPPHKLFQTLCGFAELSDINRETWHIRGNV